MADALSPDLRRRVVAAVADGLSHAAAAERFQVSASSVSRWRALLREKGDVRPAAMGGDRKSHRVDAHSQAILAALGPERDRTIVRCAPCCVKRTALSSVSRDMENCPHGDTRNCPVFE